VHLLEVLGGAGEKTSLETFRIITVFEHRPTIVADQQYQPEIGLRVAVAKALLNLLNECSFSQVDSTIINGLQAISQMRPDEFFEHARSGFSASCEGRIWRSARDKKRLFFREIPAVRDGGSVFSAYQLRIWEWAYWSMT
jgi:hypothetical protein